MKKHNAGRNVIKVLSVGAVLYFSLCLLMYAIPSVTYTPYEESTVCKNVEMKALSIANGPMECQQREAESAVLALNNSKIINNVANIYFINENGGYFDINMSNYGASCQAQVVKDVLNFGGTGDQKRQVPLVSCFQGENDTRYLFLNKTKPLRVGGAKSDEGNFIVLGNNDPIKEKSESGFRVIDAGGKQLAAFLPNCRPTGAVNIEFMRVTCVHDFLRTCENLGKPISIFSDSYVAFEGVMYRYADRKWVILTTKWLEPYNVTYDADLNAQYPSKFSLRPPAIFHQCYAKHTTG